MNSSSSIIGTNKNTNYCYCCSVVPLTLALHLKMKLLFDADWKMKHLFQSPTNRLVIFTAFLALLATSSISDASSEPVTTDGYDVNGIGTNDTVTDHHKGDHAHGVHVASWKFDYVARPLILTLFLLAVVLIKIGSSRRLLLLMMSFFILWHIS